MKKLPIGTFINMGTVIVGSLLGLMLQHVFPESIERIVTQAVGLGILIIGLQMSLKVPESLLVIFIFSLMIGGIIGETIGVKTFLDGCAETMRLNFQIGQKRFSEAFIAGLILFAASPITIVGAIEEGFQKKRDLLLVKSALDGVTAVAIASSSGIGVMVAVIPMLIVQGGLTLLAREAGPLFNKNMLAQISGIGGVLLIALAIQILNLAEFYVANLLPALFVVVLFTWGYSRLKVRV